MPRELLLMSPYTPPAQHALMLGDDVTSCWLNGWAALWHPAALRQASGPPRWIGPYDQSDPGSEQLIAMPETPPLQLASDYEDRIREKSGRSFRGVTDRQRTIENVKAALAALGDDVSKFDGESQLARHCFGLGLGYLTIEILFEAMERERTLERDKFW